MHIKNITHENYLWILKNKALYNYLKVKVSEIGFRIIFLQKVGAEMYFSGRMLAYNMQVLDEIYSNKKNQIKIKNHAYTLPNLKETLDSLQDVY